MNVKLLIAILLASLFSSQAAAQSCVHLQHPLWAYSNGMIAYAAFRTEGLCGEGCHYFTPVYHVDIPDYLSELAHECDFGEGLQQASVTHGSKRIFVSRDNEDQEGEPSLSLVRPVSADYDFFTTWNAKYAPETMRPGGDLRHCTNCQSGRNFVLVSPDGTERINIRVFQVTVARDGQNPRTYWVAYEREEGPSEGDLQADLLLQQDGPALSYRFRIADDGGSPYPDADFILLVRADRPAA